MLSLIIPDANDIWDEIHEEFISRKGAKIKLEHSLVSLAKWERHYHQPFMAHTDFTAEEELYYIKCMTLTQNVPDEAYMNITNQQLNEIRAYINDPMTATTFSDIRKEGESPNKEIITNELIYYYMIALNIPFECQKWHLNSLLTLIEVAKRKNTPEKKMNQNELISHHRAINVRRRAERAARRGK